MAPKRNTRSLFFWSKKKNVISKWINYTLNSSWVSFSLFFYLSQSTINFSKFILIILPLPDTHHRLCIWHINQNALRNFSHVFKNKKSFRKDFDFCIYNCEDEEEFFIAWRSMLDKYNLRENNWLKKLSKLREKWAMAYGRQYFSAGKKNTQLSESFNARLKNYLKSDLDIVQFSKHFERAVLSVRDNDNLANYDTSQRMPNLKVNVLYWNMLGKFIRKLFLNSFKMSMKKIIVSVYW